MIFYINYLLNGKSQTLLSASVVLNLFESRRSLSHSLKLLLRFLSKAVLQSIYRKTIIPSILYRIMIMRVFQNKIFISLFKRALKMMKNGVSFTMIALLVAELFKILIYAN